MFGLAYFEFKTIYNQKFTETVEKKNMIISQFIKLIESQTCLRYVLAIAILSILYNGGQAFRQVHELSTGKGLLKPRLAAIIDFSGDQVCFCNSLFFDHHHIDFYGALFFQPKCDSLASEGVGNQIQCHEVGLNCQWFHFQTRRLVFFFNEVF